jgi:ABC-2 type transport system ATP-binding protein
LADSRSCLEAAMAIIISKSIAGYRRRRRAEAAAPGGQRLSPDDPARTQGGRPGTPQPAHARAAASVGVPHTPVRDGPAGTAASPQPDGQAKAAGAVSREAGTPVPDGRGRSPGVPVIEVRGLRKSYDGVEAVAGIDLEVRAGEVFAFLGPNGAGKTTTVEILEGYRRRTAGEVSVLGADPARAGRDWRARIGVVLQESQPEDELTVEECLSLYAGYYPRPRPVGQTLDLVGLAGRRSVRCGRLSGGQRRRLDVALALIGDPELIFLDEPTTGFDPAARKSAWEVIAGLRDLGKTIFLTTHYMEEAEYLADRIAVLAAGRIVAEGTAATLGGRDSEAAVVSFTLPPGMSAADLPPLVAAAVTDDPAQQVLARTPAPLPLLGDLAGWAQARGLDLPDLQVHRPTLEDVYLQLTRES